MKKFILLAMLIGVFSANSSAQIAPPPEGKKVQVAILLDTSGSMERLISQAKSRIWSIINEITSLTYNGDRPNVEIALYQYGNSTLSSESLYIQQILDLTSDLDLISQKLFALTTNGGQEYCGAVIGKSLDDLKWSTDPTDLKMIYIAGNESFKQGPVQYEIECKKAKDKNIYINTIFCGAYETGVSLFWKDGATCSTGDYFNIDTNEELIHIETPYDGKINAYNDSLNTTYFGYGSLGIQRKHSQVTEDANAAMEAESVKTERAISKSKKGVYLNSSWDLIDATENEVVDIEKMKDEDLPDEFKNKTVEEKKELLEEKKQLRNEYQKKISELAQEREKFIVDEKKKRAESGEEIDDFGSSVNKSILEKAEKIGYKKETPNVE